MYVVSELLKVFASEPAADADMGHILTALLCTSCQRLTTLQVGGGRWLGVLFGEGGRGSTGCGSKGDR